MQSKGCEYTLDYDALGRVTARTDGEGNTTTFAYHPGGQIRTVTAPNGAKLYQAEYDVWGGPDSETDGNGNTTVYEKDRWGHVTKVTLPDGGIEKYHYDFAGNLNVAEDANGNRTVFRYRGDNRIRSIRKENKSIKYFWYDREGWCSGRLDANANLVRTVYNMDGNPVMITGTRNVSLSDFRQSFHATADEAGNFEERTPELRSLYTYDAQGNLVEASENGTDYHYTHDTEGRVLSKRAWGKTLYENHYDACGRLRELITGEQKTSYGYDKAGRLAEVCASNGIRAQYRYDKNDMQTEVLYGNGLRTSYTYDERSQLTEMETVFPGMSNPLFRGTYAYDANGCRISKTEQIRMDATTPLKVMETCYTYDAMERLTKESLNGAVTSYGYDLAGNRITKSTDGRTEKYFYNNRNQLTELHREKDVVRYSYDPAGNLTEENYLTADGASTKKLHYVYDVYNRNVSVTGDDFTQKNHYDAEGYRDSITEKDKVTNFVYQGGMLLHELDEDKNPARHYVLGNEYIGLDHNYYLTDEQGSVRYVLDAAGNVQNDYQYDAFGQRIAGHENIPNRLRYNAQIEDDLTGLYYLRARYYNTGIGRFTQEDVIYNDGLNLYAYCSSNPVMYSDPSGFAKKPCKSKVGGECGNSWVRMTAKESAEAAKKLGFEKTNMRAKNNEPIYYNRKTKTYISQDIGSGDGSGPHNGGVWKQAKTHEKLNSKGTRMGTYDANLNRIGD